MTAPNGLPAGKTRKNTQQVWTRVIGMPHVRRADRPDRDARAFLRILNMATRLRPVEHYSLRALREVWRLTSLALGQQPPVATVNETVIDGPGGPIELRIFKPHQTDQLLPAFLWCHGGGFVVGGLDSCESICRSTARNANCISIAVRYRLAPEHDLAAGREDCLAALQWVAENGATLGIDTSRLAIGGDSAGGNICAAVAQQALRNGGPALCLQVLAYPATDLVQEFPSFAENAEGFMITDRLLAQINQTVAGSLHSLNPEAPWLSPRRSQDMQGLPPALVISAGFDPIRDDGLDYSARLRAAGVPVELLHYAGQFHGFLNFDAVIGAGADALQRIGESLAGAFRTEPAADRTVEIADRAAAQPSRLCAAMGELSTSSLMVSVATERWTGTLLREVSPVCASTLRVALRPWSAPLSLMRRRLSARLDRRIAHQTYPQA
ncbi:esterase/lipase [Pseudomonas sp. GM78]|uniref:alpha/beta hydrolase n=1 Tax=Pseudomonas sp. GM78 TaxID=1144337 RepID=UPI000270B219|nr:alpha/beta hydrolase [Pseudomonas sp. GM78]EJN24319.1 esterase/lipase [Pseudomonas sp. GM78]